MTALTVIEDGEVLEERRAGRDVGRERRPRQQRALQRGEEALGHGVVVAVADRAQRAADPHRLRALPEPERGELAARVRGGDDARAWSPVPDRHLQGCHDQFAAQVRRQRPADHAPTAHREKHGQREDPLPGRHVGTSGDPELVGSACAQRRLDQLRGRRGFGVTLRRVDGAPAMTPDETRTAQQARAALVPAAGPCCQELRRHAR